MDFARLQRQLASKASGKDTGGKPKIEFFSLLVGAAQKWIAVRDSTLKLGSRTLGVIVPRISSSTLAQKKTAFQLSPLKSIQIMRANSWRKILLLRSEKK